MTKADRLALLEMAQRCNIESIVAQLSSICSWQEIKAETEQRRKAWRKAELQLDRVAQNLPYELRNPVWSQDQYEGA